MKLVDFDGLFDEKLTQFMEENKNKYTEKQWEDIIPKLYKKFGDTYVAKVKCTPKEYYGKMQNAELVQTLREHLSSDVPVPEFLCAEIESRGEAETLAPMLFDENEAAVSYAINLIGDNPKAYDAYFTILEKNLSSEEIRSDLADVFKFHADQVKDRALSNFEKGIAKEYMLEILSRVKEKEDRIFKVLLSAFLSGENVPMHASYLAAYNDERALSYLMKKIEDQTIGFVEFQELKYAIEALGGEYDEPRDFTSDKDYIAVEAAAIKRAKTDENEIRS